MPPWSKLLDIIPIFILLSYKYLRFKALKLNTTVEELTKQENQDDYLDEYGYVNHFEEKENKKGD